MVTSKIKTPKSLSKRRRPRLQADGTWLVVLSGGEVGTEADLLRLLQLQRLAEADQDTAEYPRLYLREFQQLRVPWRRRKRYLMTQECADVNE